MWKYYAVLSAVFAALTAILAKIGVLILHERLDWQVVVGGLLILAGSMVLLL